MEICMRNSKVMTWIGNKSTRAKSGVVRCVHTNIYCADAPPMGRLFLHKKVEEEMAPPTFFSTWEKTQRTVNDHKLPFVCEHHISSILYFLIFMQSRDGIQKYTKKSPWYQKTSKRKQMCMQKSNILEVQEKWSALHWKAILSALHWMLLKSSNAGTANKAELFTLRYNTQCINFLMRFVLLGL